MTATIKKNSAKRTIKRKIESLNSLKPQKTLNAYKYLGIIKIKEDPNQIQKKLRDEWR